MRFYIAKDSSLCATPGYHLYDTEPTQVNGYYTNRGSGHVTYLIDSIAESILGRKIDFIDGVVEIEINVVDGKGKESSVAGLTPSKEKAFGITD